MAKNLDECNFDKHSNFKYLVFQDKNPKEFQFLNHYNSRHGSKPLSYKVLSEMIGDDFRKKFLAKNSDISLIKNGVNKSLVKLKEEQEKFIDENSDLFIDFAGKKITKVEYCRTINKKIKNLKTSKKYQENCKEGIPNSYYIKFKKPIEYNGQIIETKDYCNQIDSSTPSLKTSSKYLDNCKKFIVKKENIKDSNKIKAIACAVEVWTKKDTFYDLFIFSDTGKSCKEIGSQNWKNISYQQYLEIKKNPKIYSSKYWDTKTQTYKFSNSLIDDLNNVICFNNNNDKINNLSRKCSKEETELYVSSGDLNNLYLDKANTKVVKKKSEIKSLTQKINENEKNLKVASSIECYNPNTDKIEIWINYKICPGNRTLVAEKEPSKPQKKIAKTNNSNQNETIKKKVNADKEAPVIEIADTITVKDTTYEIAGMVKDKSDTVYIEIDGQTILAENGKFKFQKYSPVDHQLQIVAIDQWGNRSEPKMVDVKINIQVAGTSKVIEPLNPSKLIAKIDRNKVALVIGVEKYENSPSAKYASLDAKYFKDYARKVFGVREDNINLLTDEEANLSKTNSAFFKWLPSKIKSNQTDLIIFYAGHGLASTDGKEKYILPFNADPDLLSRTAISRKEIFDQIISLNPRSVTIFFDTCYSGVSRDEQMLLASARPLRVIADDEEQLPDNFTIFSASKNDQISSGLSDAKHGIFSYFLMKGLEGKADLNGDRKLTNNELLTYLDDNVSEKALDLGRQQNPTLSGNPEQVLAKY